jgi:hypothetical protein
MRYWAEIDPNNTVIRVILIGEDHLDNGVLFLNSIGGEWIECSNDGSLRKNAAAPGMVYDRNRDAFIWPVSPYPSWNFNEETCKWEAPSVRPKLSEGVYAWDEDLIQWVLFNPESI